MKRKLSSGRSTKPIRSTEFRNKLKKLKMPPTLGSAGKRSKPYRDIDKDGVTYSFLSEFLLDREAARMSYVEGFQEAGMIGAIEFGQCFHNCLEATAANGNVPPSAHEIVKKYIKKRVREAKLRGNDKLSLEQLGQITAMMYPLYHEFWRHNNGIEFQPNAQFVAQEESFEVPYSFVGPDNMVINMKLRGRFDAIFRSDGSLWLMENKTKSQIDSEGLTASLSMDLQTMMYCLAIKLKYGEYPAGVLYNVIKRPGHRFGVRDTPASFLQRIQDAVVANPNEYFMRWHVDINEVELDDWTSRSFNPILFQVRRWWDSIKKDPFNPWKSPWENFVNPEALYTRYGKSKYFGYYTRKSLFGLRRTSKKRK